MKNEVKFVAQVTVSSEGNVVVDPVQENAAEELFSKDFNSEGTLYAKRKGKLDYVVKKKGKIRHRERDKLIKAVGNAALLASPSGSRIKVNIALDREAATDKAFLLEVAEITADLQDVLVKYFKTA